MVLSEKQKEIIERIGVFFEKKGMQPVVGRITGLLLLAEPAEATFDEITETLHVSKSAVSNALTFMQGREIVDYTTKPGDRKRYFKLRVKDWRNDMKKDFDELLDIDALIAEVIDLKKDKNTEFCCYLYEMKDFLAFMRKELPLLLKKFEARRK